MADRGLLSELFLGGGLLHNPDFLAQQLTQMGLLSGGPAGVMWHGSPSGTLGGGRGGVHVGTRKAAEAALGARIGIPASGSWAGNRLPYGQTLLAGRETLNRLDPRGYNVTGYNVNAPAKDYLPTAMPSYSGGQAMSPASIPTVLPYTIAGPMTNTPRSPHSDVMANALAGRSNARRGFYYRNEGEDVGSISAAVPSGAHLTPLQYLINLFGGG